MANHRNKNQQADRSQRPAFQQVSTRPAVGGEPAQDNVRVPAPSTVDESQAAAQVTDADRYVPSEGSVTTSDALPGQATDLVGGDDTVLDDLDSTSVEQITEAENAAVNSDSEDGIEFSGFAEPAKTLELTTVSLTAQQQTAIDNELMPVMPRRTVMRTSIGGKWWNFFKGQEQFVPKYVRDHLLEKGVI
jgi:hypothetical protein